MANFDKTVAPYYAKWQVAPGGAINSNITVRLQPPKNFDYILFSRLRCFIYTFHHYSLSKVQGSTNHILILKLVISAYLGFYLYRAKHIISGINLSKMRVQ